MNKIQTDRADAIDSAGCPRTSPACDTTSPLTCMALGQVSGGDGSELSPKVKGLLECRGFLWDVLTEGEWTGCSRRILRHLAALYGPEAMLEAFGEG